MAKKREIVVSMKDIDKKFSGKKVISNINFEFEKGKSYGILGHNGAGKSTIIRILLGFIKASNGNSSVLGQDSWNSFQDVAKKVSFLSSEINIPENEKAKNLIDFLYKLNNGKDHKKIDYLVNYFELNPDLKIKSMSKGTKQKVLLVLTFMIDSEIIILDEPTTGLDPLMQNKLMDHLFKLKQDGKTIILSSHIFSEIEKICDDVMFLKSGEIIKSFNLKQVKEKQNKIFKIEFEKDDHLEEFLIKNDKSDFIYEVPIKDISVFLKKLSKFDVVYFEEIVFSLEKHFIDLYKRNEGNK